jgi:hypothetical protein
MLCKSISGKRRILLAILLLTPLISVSFGAVLVNLAHANFIVPPIPSLTVTIQLPESNEVYTENSVHVSFKVQRTYERVYMLDKPDLYTYMLDGVEGFFTPQISTETDYYLCEWTLSGLSEGDHRLVISVQYAYHFSFAPNTDYRTSGGCGVVFMVNAVAPRVSVVSPGQLKTYNTTTLPLVFNVSEPFAWLAYSLDGAETITIAGNATLSGLSEGTHTLVIQAQDLGGSIGESTPAKFKVETQTAGQQTGSEPSTFPTTEIVAVAVVSFVVVCAGLLLYFFKFKKRSGAA